ncbi:hypothetical protein NDI56_00745 [Haloarcula sp. S1CR25-12]|uniref:Uncharacterized protein n=1 Tax=Haloarcula saliterrae TaxID=2950534 RepID=A0ABU2F852_9EURY|nr:hypothetical protein [Haloarcula sp. S1CR25-12]MDS0257930.1 hypothetical protein [Haloarcula sp. S1CR25-12]
MTDHEQAKAALAALAEGEPERREGSATGQRHRRVQGRPKDSVPDRTDAPESMPRNADRAGEHATYRTVIQRAVAATDDLDAAAEFVESVGLERLEAAVETAEHEVSGLADDGREALAAFERFRVAAEGPVHG